jgi:metallo-beta-lactamase family protein
LGRVPDVTHFGAAHGVTGSCHHLAPKGLNILVDCGLAQGRDPVVPMESWPVKPSDVDFVFLTHAHVDHVGALPELVRRGFRGEILTTHPTRALLLPMLEDAMGFSQIPEEEVPNLCARIDELTWGFEYGEEFDLRDGLRFRFRRAGHILGSASVWLSDRGEGWSVLFSGDLGGPDRPLLPDPDPPDPCDLLVLEATYGDRAHPPKGDRPRSLGRALSRALADGGKVLIPSFALGRTQELLYELDRLASEPALAEEFPVLASDSRIPVFLDSPLGARLTEIHQKLTAFWDREARALLRSGDNPLDFDRLYEAGRYRDHLKILEYPGACIVIAGSGMCSGGRIVDHLKACLEDARNDVIFIGYQAQGTPGRRIVECARNPSGSVELEGERFAVRARVHVLPGFSAHADRDELIAWVRSMPAPPDRIRLVHGDAQAKQALGESLRELGYDVEGAR